MSLAFANSHNLNDCLNCPGSFDTWSVYVDEHGNLVGEGRHHDGTNYYTFYECDKETLKEAIDKALLSNSNLKNVLQQDNIQHLMKPMGQYVAKIYGFDLGKEDFDTTIKECEKKNEEINKGKEVLSKDNKSLEK